MKTNMHTVRKHILVVDDEPQITRQIRLNLELGGEYIVREENEADHALAAAAESHTDLVLLDVMMPGIDGGELASQFRASSKFRNVPIVFLTAAVTAEEVKKHGGYIGGDRFLAKPVDPAELSQCLREELEKRAPHPASQTAGNDTSPHLAY